MHTELN